MLDHFGILAPFYEVFIKPKAPEYLWDLAQLPVPGALLDAGGGTGRIAQFLSDQASSVVVADLSFDMLKQATRKDNLKTVCSHSEILPFPDDYFERIIMIDALHHVCNQAETALELWRVLAPGGLLVIEEPDVRTFAVKLIALGEKLALMRSHFLAPPEIVQLFNGVTAHSHIERDKYISWVIVQKPAR